MIVIRKKIFFSFLILLILALIIFSYFFSSSIFSNSSIITTKNFSLSTNAISFELQDDVISSDTIKNNYIGLYDDELLTLNEFEINALNTLVHFSQPYVFYTDTLNNMNLFRIDTLDDRIILYTDQYTQIIGTYDNLLLYANDNTINSLDLNTFERKELFISTNNILKSLLSGSTIYALSKEDESQAKSIYAYNIYTQISRTLLSNENIENIHNTQNTLYIEETNSIYAFSDQSHLSLSLDPDEYIITIKSSDDSTLYHSNKALYHRTSSDTSTIKYTHSLQSNSPLTAVLDDYCMIANKLYLSLKKRDQYQLYVADTNTHMITELDTPPIVTSFGFSSNNYFGIISNEGTQYLSSFQLNTLYINLLSKYKGDAIHPINGNEFLIYSSIHTAQ